MRLKNILGNIEDICFSIGIIGGAFIILIAVLVIVGLIVCLILQGLGIKIF